MLSWGYQYSFENLLCRDMILFHDLLMGVLVFLGVFVGGLLVMTVLNPFVSNVYLEGHSLETVWTLFPLVVVLLMFYPSLRVLNSNVMLSAIKPEKVVKMVGHQWYWEYRYPWGGSVAAYDSFPVSMEESKNFIRNLEVSSAVLFESQKVNELNITSVDVIHSFALPKMGIKLDAVPGRVNTSSLCNLVNGLSVVHGQCSEICGVYHGNMPILALFV